MKTRLFGGVTSSAAKKFSGKYIAVSRGKIIAVGRRRLEAYRKAKRVVVSQQPLGLYYIPTRREMLSALWNFLT